METNASDYMTDPMFVLRSTMQHLILSTMQHLILWITMSYSLGFTQNLVYLGQHLNGLVPILVEDLSVLWSKETYLRVWIWTLVYRRALASGHCFLRFMQANCLGLSRGIFLRFTATLTTRSCMCPSVQTRALGNLRLSLLFSTV